MAKSENPINDSHFCNHDDPFVCSFEKNEKCIFCRKCDESDNFDDEVVIDDYFYESGGEFAGDW